MNSTITLPRTELQAALDSRDAARYRWVLKNGFHYADNPNVSDYHKGGIHISGLYLESYDHEGLNAAIDAAIERAGEKK